MDDEDDFPLARYEGAVIEEIEDHEDGVTFYLEDGRSFTVWPMETGFIIAPDEDPPSVH